MQTSEDIAIGLIFFNPCQSKRMLMNHLHVANAYRRQAMPVFTIELVFSGQAPEIPDALHVAGNSYMFHKERLCHLLEMRIPPQYTKLVFLDSDVLLSKNWLSDVDHALDDNDLVQPFEHAHWLNMECTKVLQTRRSVLLMSGDRWDAVGQQLHPGFAWAFRREWFQKVGFFQWGITGSGDSLSAAAWMRREIPAGYPSLPESLKAAYDAFRHLPAPRIGYCKNGEVFHLYHGPLSGRQYFQRHRIINVPTDIRELISLNPDGVFEWNDPQRWNPPFLAYFKGRNDDMVEQS